MAFWVEFYLILTPFWKPFVRSFGAFWGQNQATGSETLPFSCVFVYFSLWRHLGDPTWDHFGAVWMLKHRFWMNCWSILDQLFDLKTIFKLCLLTFDVVYTQQLTTNGPQPTAHSPQPTVHSQQPTANSPQPTVHSPQPTAHSPQPTAYSPQPIAHILQPAAHSSQSTAHSPQPTAYSPQSTAHSPQPTLIWFQRWPGTFRDGQELLEMARNF